MLISVVVDSVRMNPVTGQRVVILKDGKLDRYLLIWIGATESTAIAMELQGEKPPRPMTIDLLKTAITTLGARVTEVAVTALSDDVYHARVALVTAQDERLDLDARASDGIALALRCEAPLFVDEAILEQASITMAAEQEDERLDVYRDFVNELFERGPGLEEGERRPDA